MIVVFQKLTLVFFNDIFSLNIFLKNFVFKSNIYDIPDFLFQLIDCWVYFYVEWLRNSSIIQPMSKVETLKLWIAIHYWVVRLS